MPQPLLDELRNTLEHEIPVCAHMGFRVHAWDGQQLALSAPLAGNRNHQRTAFAGSLNALCTVAGWGSVFLLVRGRELDGDIVIRRSTIKYLKPVTTSEILARCLPIDAAQRDHFLEMLQAKNQAKIDVGVEVSTAGETVVAFLGSYVVLGREPNG